MTVRGKATYARTRVLGTLLLTAPEPSGGVYWGCRPEVDRTPPPPPKKKKKNKKVPNGAKVDLDLRMPGKDYEEVGAETCDGEEEDEGEADGAACRLAELAPLPFASKRVTSPELPVARMPGVLMSFSRLLTPT